MSNTPRYVFFGTPEVATTFLDALEQAHMLPALIVSAPDKPAGRGLTLTASPVSQWARTHNIELVQPEKIDEYFLQTLRARGTWDVFVVVAYGMLLPQDVIELPTHGTLNVHFSLLPRWRGASPVEAAILAGDETTGAAIQVMRLKLDTGPVIALDTTSLLPQETAPELRGRLGEIGARLLVQTLPRYLAGELGAKEQDEALATYARKIKKEDGDITNDDDLTRWRKYRAYAQWPGTYVFVQTKDALVRVKVVRARYENNTFVIERVVPEGKKETDYESFLRSRV